MANKRKSFDEIVGKIENNTKRESFDEIVGKIDSFDDMVGKVPNVRYTNKNQQSVSDQIRQRNEAAYQERQDAIKMIQKSAGDRSQEDYNNLPEGAYDYVNQNRKTSAFNNAIYNATKNNDRLKVVNNVAAIAKDNTSSLLQTKYGMDKEKADYYERNWNSIKGNKEHRENLKNQEEVLSKMDEKEYELLKTYSKSMSALNFTTDSKIQMQEIKERQAAKNELKEAYGLSDEEIAKYSDYVSRDTNKKYNEKMKEEAAEVAKNPAGKVALSGLSVGLAPIAGISSAANTALSRLNGKPVDVYDDSFLANNFKDISRGAVSDTIENPLLNFVYNAGMSFADSRASVALGRNISSYLGLGANATKLLTATLTNISFGTNAFSSTLRDSIEKGQNENQAVAYAMASGINEGLFEALSVENLLNISNKEIVSRPEIIKAILKQGGFEFSEEINTDIANMIADRAINGDYSDYDMRRFNLEENGYTPEEAKKMAMVETTKQIFLDGLAGFFSGVLGGGIEGFKNYHTTNRLQQSTSDDTIKKAVDTALNSEVSKGTKAEEIAKRVSEGTKTEDLSGEERRQLLSSLIQSQDTEIDNVINTGLEENIKDADTLEKAKSLFDEYRNSEMTDEEFEEKLVNEVAKNSEERNAVLKVKNDIETGKTALPINQVVDQAQTENQIEVIKHKIEKVNTKEQKEAARTYQKFLANENKTADKKYAGLNGVARVATKDNPNAMTKRIASLNGDDSLIELDNGKQVKFSELQFSDDTMGQLYNQALSLPTKELATIAVNSYKGQLNIEGYVNAIKVAYNSGLASTTTHQTAEQFIQNMANAKLLMNVQDSQAIKEAFLNGENIAKRDLKERKTVNPTKKTQAQIEDSAKINLNSDSELATTLAAVGVATNTEVEETDAIKNNAGQYVKEIKGSYKNNNLKINRTSKNMYQTLLHEGVMEKMKAENPTGYYEVADAVLNYMIYEKGNEYLVNVLERYEEAYKNAGEGATISDVADEYVNDFVAGIFSTKEGITDFADWVSKKSESKTRNIFESIANLCDRIITEINKYLGNSKAMNAGAIDGYNAAKKQAVKIRSLVLKYMDELDVKDSAKDTMKGNDKETYSVEVLDLTEEEKQAFTLKDNGDVVFNSTKYISNDLWKNITKEFKKLGYDFKDWKHTKEYYQNILDTPYSKGILLNDDQANVIKTFMGLNTEKEEVNPEAEIKKAKEYAVKAEKTYGTTRDWNKASYLDVNGKLIDFSDGQYSRVKDHREISEILDLPEDAEYSDGLIEFMRQGNIRLQTYGIDISVKPNDVQKSMLRSFFNKLDGEVTVDFSRLNGDNAGTAEYTEGTASSRILNDIDSFFKTGEVPEGTYDGNTYYSIEIGMTDEERFNELKDKSIKIVKFDNEKFEELNKDPFKFQERNLTNTKKELKTIYDNLKIGERKFRSEDIDIEFMYTKNGVRETVGKGLKMFQDFYEKNVKLFTVLPNVCHNAMLIKAYTSEEYAKLHPEHKVNQFLKNTYVFISAYEDEDDTIIPQKITLFEYNNGDIAKAHLIMAIAEIKKADIINISNSKELFMSPSTFEISLADLLRQVKLNEKGEALSQYIPDQFIDYLPVKNTMKDEHNTGKKQVEVDSEGSNLSQGQKEYFQDSVVRDEDGRLLVMYHGTPNATFTKFKPGTYFTPNKEYADKYQSPTASSISTKRTVDNPDTYKVYLNITKPFDTRLPEVRKIWDEQYYHKWDTGELTDNGIIDWTAVEGVRDFIEENELDFDGIIADEGSTGGYGEEVQYRGLSYIVMYPNQVKNVDNENPTSDPDIRFSVEIPEYTLPEDYAFRFTSDEDMDARYDEIERQEGIIKDFWRQIVEDKDFKALRFKVGKNSYILHESTRPEADYQLSYYDDKGAIGHFNYHKTNMDKLYQDLTSTTLFEKNRTVELLPEEMQTRFQVEMDEDFLLFQELIENDEELQSASNIIKNSVMSLNDISISDKDVKKIATQIKNTYKTNVKVDDIANSLKQVFAYMKQDNVNYDSLVVIMKEVAKPLLENVTEEKSTRTENWDKFREYLNHTKFKLNAKQISEVTSAFGSTDNYRKKLFGITTISRDGLYLDDIWSELVDASGNTLPANVADTNQPQVLIDTINGLKPQVESVNTYGMNLESASYDLALDIYRQFFESQINKNSKSDVAEAVGKIRAQQVAWRRRSVEQYKTKLEEVRKELEIANKKNIKELAEEITNADANLQTALEQHDEVAAAIIQDLKNKNNRKIEQIRKQKNDEIAKIKAQNFDSRKNERDRRKNTALKEQLRKQIDSLNKMLKSPNTANFIKPTMVQGTIEVLEAIDLDTGKSKGMKEKLARLAELYDNYSSDKTFDFDYDASTYDMIIELRNTFADRNYTMLTNDELVRVVELVQRLKTQIQNASKLLLNEKYNDAAKAAQDIISEVNHTKGSLDSSWETKFDRYFSLQLNAYRWFRKTSGYVDGGLMSMYNDLDKGQLKMIQMQKEINEMFAPLLEGRENQANIKRLSSTDEKDLVDIGLNVDGQPYKVTRGMMLSFLMHIQNYDNARHLVLSGFTLPDLKLYEKGRFKEAYQKSIIGEFYNFDDIKQAADAVQGNRKDAVFEDGIKEAIKTLQFRSKKLRESLSDWEQDYLAASEKLFHEYLGEKINEVSVLTRGYALAQVKNYFPINTDKNFTRQEFASLKRDGSLEGMGFLKERVKASNPILLEDISNVILRQTENTSRYYGLSVPVRNINMVMNMNFRNAMTPKSAISSKWGVKNSELFEKIVQDVQTGRNNKSELNETFTALRGNFAAATLTANIGVAMKQAASYPTAAAVLGSKPLKKALKDIPKGFTKKGIPELEERNPLLWYRSKGQASADIAYAKQSNVYKWLDSKAPLVKAISVDLIQNVDSATVRTLEYASMYYVDENFKDLEKGSDAYWDKVSEIFTKVVEETQPNYTVLQRPELLKDGDNLVRQLFMFKTQPLQNLGILYDALGEYSTVKKKYNRNTLEFKNAATKLSRAIWSQLVAATVFSCMSLVANLAYHKVYKYKQDDDKPGWLEALLGVVSGIGSTLSGIVFGGDWLYSAISEKIFGTTNYGIEVSIVEMFNDVNEMFNNFNKYSAKLAEAKTETERETAWKKLAGVAEDGAVLVGQYFGVPVNNIKNTIGGLYLPIKDLYTGVEWGDSQFSWDETPETQYLRMYEALLSNDMARYDKLYKEQVSISTADEPEKNVDNKIKSMLKKAYLERELTAEQVATYLNNANIEVTEYMFDEWDYKAETGATTYSKYSRIKDAMRNSFENNADRKAIKTEIDKLLKSGVDKSTIASEITRTYKQVYLSNKSANMKNFLITCFMYCGYTKEEAMKRIDNWK